MSNIDDDRGVINGRTSALRRHPIGSAMTDDVLAAMQRAQNSFNSNSPMPSAMELRARMEMAREVKLKHLEAIAMLWPNQEKLQKEREEDDQRIDDGVAAAGYNFGFASAIRRR